MRVFRQTYTDPRTKQRRETPKFYIEFRDHNRILRRWPIFKDQAGDKPGSAEKRTQEFAHQVERLMRIRESNDQLTPSLREWIDAMPLQLREKLIEAELVDAGRVETRRPLLELLDGGDGDPGYRQAMEAKGVTAQHVRPTMQRCKRIISECGFTYWQDLLRAGAETRVSVYLGELRTGGEIRGKTLNYYVRDFKTFCRWLAKYLRLAAAPMSNLEGVGNTEADSDVRRAITVEEMRALLDTTAAGVTSQNGLTGDERAILYRFAFETGIRPNQIRQLTVGDFDLQANPATVTTHAKFVKRRRTHTQVLTTWMAAELRKRFARKFPHLPAFKLPSATHMAEMIRLDLAAARAAWIKEAGDLTSEERTRRNESDFLLAVNHQGQKAVFYSTRHGHGTALADAGVPEKDIAASMHHASRATTVRYLHSGQKEVGQAITRIPDLSPTRQIATGTDGAEVQDDPPRLSPRLVSQVLPTGSRYGKTRSDVDPAPPATPRKPGENAVNSGKATNGLLAELADAMDSKSLARKGVSVRLR